MKILVTGSLGFIGFHLSKKLLSLGHTVLGLDNIDDYYDTKLKLDRGKILKSKKKYIFNKIDISNKSKLEEVLKGQKITHAVNLAAQAGMNYAFSNPEKFIKSNIIGHFNLLEFFKQSDLKHFLYASSASIYGQSSLSHNSLSDNTDLPTSLYASTKKSNEVLSHSYSHLYSLPQTGLRLFTAYGPYGRPDMAIYHFTKKILQGKEIELFNYGNNSRDFIYIDDLINALIELIELPSKKRQNQGFKGVDQPTSPHRIYNLGQGKSIFIKDLVALLEQKLEKKATIKLLPKQPGDLTSSLSNNDALKELINFQPKVSLNLGLDRFIEWFKDYHKIK